MKTLYRQNHTRNKARIIGTISLFFLIIMIYAAGKPLLSFFSGVFAPAGIVISRAEGQTASAFGSIGSYFLSKSTLQDENSRLKGEMELMRLSVIRTESLEEENAELRALLGRSARDDSAILTEVMIRPPTSPFDTMIIDVGRASGVEDGDTASVSGFIVGSIARVDDRTSVLRLWSYPGNTFDIVIGEKFSGRAEGQGGGSFRIRAPRDVPVVLGDIVSVPSINGMLLGTVAAIDSNPENPFSDIYVSSPVNLRTVRFMEVVK